MKKIILSLGLMLSLCGAAYADCDYQCVAPYNLNNKFRASVSKIFGVNSIVRHKLEKVIAKEVLKIASADKVAVQLDSYSPKDLKNGIFKSMEVSASNVVLNDIYLTSLDLKTLCDFNYIKQSDKDIVFVESMPMSFDLSMSADAINKTIQNAKYEKILNDLNKIGGSYGIGVKVSSTKVTIKSNKLYYIISFDIPFVTKEPKIVIQADLLVKDGKISYNNTKLVSGKFNIDLPKIDFIMDYLNPLDFSVNILENKDAKVSVNNVSISDNLVRANGTIIIPKD